MISPSTISFCEEEKKNPIKYPRWSKKTCFPLISIQALWTFTVYPPCESLWRITLTSPRETLIKAVMQLFLLCHLSHTLSFLQALFKSKPRPLICVPCLVFPPSLLNHSFSHLYLLRPFSSRKLSDSAIRAWQPHSDNRVVRVDGLSKMGTGRLSYLSGLKVCSRFSSSPTKLRRRQLA